MNCELSYVDISELKVPAFLCQVDDLIVMILIPISVTIPYNQIANLNLTLCSCDKVSKYECIITFWRVFPGTNGWLE